MNSENPIVLEKLKQIENQRRHYTAVIEPFFMIILGVITSLIATLLIQPLYTFLGTIR